MKHLICICLFAVVLPFFSGCSNDDDKDWNEKVVLYVASNVVDFYPFENNGVPIDGINVREKNSNLWTPLPVDFIEGFVFEEGYEYELKVIKTHLAKYPMDSFNFTYKLENVVSKKPTNR